MAIDLLITMVTDEIAEETGKDRKEILTDFLSTSGLFWSWRIELRKGGQLPFGVNIGSIKNFFHHNIKNGGISYLLKVHKNILLSYNVL